MELDELKQLFELLKETDITEVQIEREGTKVRIKREKFLNSFDLGHTGLHEQHAPAPTAAPAEPAPAPVEEAARTVTVTAPLVGTFYSSPSPEAAPFVKTGESVKKGQVLCIIEAMKLMNEIESDVDGIVRRAMVENGSPVEYGEPLFLVEPY